MIYMVIKQPKQQYKSYVNSYDCSEIAEDLYNTANGEGHIYEVRPVEGNLRVPEYGYIDEFEYHQVYSDGIQVYDPRYSLEAIDKGTYFRMLEELNPGGITVK